MNLLALQGCLLMIDLLFHCSFGTKTQVFDSVEGKLKRKLLNGYNPTLRPENPEYQNRTLVKMGMTLIQIISVNEKLQELTTTGYLTHVWYVNQFRWDLSDYDGIHICRIPASQVWTPRIVLQNNKEGSFDVALKTNVLIHHNGKVEWLPPALYKSTCRIEVKMFPFDWQNCSMIFRSPTYDKSEMKLGLEYGNEIVVDKAAFQPNGEWDLIQKPIRINLLPHDPLYEDVAFYFILRRRPQFYVMNLIVPCILLSSLSCFVFYLPSVSCEKMTLSISILLGETVFLFLIAQRMPETSLAVPLIAAYLLFCMTLVVLCVITSVFVCNVHYRSNTTHRMSDWVETFFMDYLGPWMGVDRPGAEEDTPNDSRTRRTSSILTPGAMKNRSRNNLHSEVIFQHQATRFGLRKRYVKDEGGFTELSDRNDTKKIKLPIIVQSVPLELKTAVDAVNYIALNKKMENYQSSSEDDWAYVARVLDYFILLIYSALFTLGTLGFFMQITFADYPKAS